MSNDTMFSEAELRQALHSVAERADELPASTTGSDHAAPVQRHPGRMHDHGLGSVGVVRAEDVDSAGASVVGRHRFATVATVAAAAAVVAAVTGGAMVTAVMHRSAHRTPVGIAGASTNPSVPNSRGPMPTRSAPPEPVSVPATVGFSNLVTVGAARASYRLPSRASNQAEIIDVADGGTLLWALPAAAGFDPARSMPGATNVTVGDRPGYYGTVSISPSQLPSSKTGPARATLAWSGANGTWIFLSAYYNAPDLSVRQLQHLVRAWKVTAAPVAITVPFRFGWLPAGLTLSTLDYAPGDPLLGMRLTDGARAVDLVLYRTNVLPVRIKDIHPTVTVTGVGYSRAVLERISRNVDITRFRGAPSAWFPLVTALAG